MIHFVLGFVIGFLIGLSILLTIGDYLATSDAPTRSDAIVALSGDTSGARARTAVALYRAEYAPLVIFSGGSEDPDSVSSAAVMREQAIAAGVPLRAIVVEPQSRTTEENARFVRALLQERGLHTILLVTSPYHQRRAALEFARSFADTDIRFRNVPADEAEWDRALWWLRRDSRDLTVLELTKLSAALMGR